MSAAIHRAIRSINTAAEHPRLTRFSLQPPKMCYLKSTKAKVGLSIRGGSRKEYVEVEVEYANGNVYKLPAEFLRIYSPAADSKIRSVAGEKLVSLKQVISGRRHVGIMSGEPVGNYGVRLIFDDLHKTGIYTWDYLYDLSSNKFTLMRNYIKTLKKHGLSRDPPRRR